MPNFLVLGIYFLLSGNSKGKGWNRFLHGDYVEDEDANYGMSNFIGITTKTFLSGWRHQGGDDVAAMEYFSSVSSSFCRG
jgi:hypothetical protein